MVLVAIGCFSDVPHSSWLTVDERTRYPAISARQPKSYLTQKMIFPGLKKDQEISDVDRLSEAIHRSGKQVSRGGKYRWRTAIVPLLASRR